MIGCNIQAEQAVIGDILLDADKVMPAAVYKLIPDDFGQAEYKTLFSACLSLYREGKPIDIVTLISMVGEEYKPCAVMAAQATPTISNYEYYIEAVLESSQKRKAWAASMELIETIDENQDINTCQQAAAQILSCFDQKTNAADVSAVEGFMQFVDRMENPKSHIKTGFSKLDSFTYLDKGDYIVIGGRPSSGKTALTLQMMVNMAKTYEVAYFSLETNPDKIFDRVLSTYTHTPLSKIKQYQIGEDDWFPITICYDDFSKLRFTVVPAAGYTVDMIRAKAMQLQADIIFIDYLSLIQGPGKSLYEKVTGISMGLHILAQQHGITVIALSQLNRDGKNAPDMTSLRESGQIEQDADWILLLHNVDPDTPSSDRDLIIAKNKEGRTGKILLCFDGQYQRFSEVETRYQEG